MLEDIVRAAYARLDAGDADGFLAVFRDDAKFFVGGATSISGDHDREGFRTIVPRLASVAGQLKRDHLGLIANDEWASSVVHEYVTRDGEEIGYHVMHGWETRDGELAYFWIYVHEYDAFDRAWA